MTIYEKDPALYDAIYGGDDASSYSFVDWVLKFLDIKKSDLILDMGAGTGSILIPLTDQGYSIEGVEPFQPMINYAKKKAEKINVKIQLSSGSFQSLNDKSKYHQIMAINGPLHYVEPSDLEKSIQNVSEALLPGGFFIVDLINFFSIIKNYEYPEPLEFELDGNPATAIIRHIIDLDNEKWTNRVVLFYKDQEYQKFVDDQVMSMYTKTHLDMIAANYNLLPFEMFCSYEDRPEHRVYGGRLIIIYQKSK